MCAVRTDTVPAPRAHLSLLQTFAVKVACAGSAGVIGASIAFPLDMAKTRLQAQALGTKKAASVHYNGVVHCIRTVLATEGAGAIYKGLKPTLVGTFPEKAIKLGMNDFVRGLLADEKGHVSIANGCLAGAAAGLTQVTATNPMEIVKVQQQKPVNKAETGLQAFRRLWFRGLYQGLPATLTRDIPFSIIYFGTFGYLDERFATNAVTGEKDSLKVFASGLFSGMLGAFLSTPADVVKTRIQLENAAIRHMVPQAKAIWAKEGLRGFFLGAWPRCVAIGTLFAIAQASFSVQKQIMVRNGWV